MHLAVSLRIFHTSSVCARARVCIRERVCGVSLTKIEEKIRVHNADKKHSLTPPSAFG